MKHTVESHELELIEMHLRSIAASLARLSQSFERVGKAAAVATAPMRALAEIVR